MNVIYVFPPISSNPKELDVFTERCRESFRVVLVDYPRWQSRKLNRPDLTGLIAHCRRQIEPAAAIVLVGFSFGGHLAFAVGADLANSADVTVCMLDTSSEPYLGPNLRPELNGLFQKIRYSYGKFLFRAQYRLARVFVEGPAGLLQISVRCGGFTRPTVQAIHLNLNGATLRAILKWMSQAAKPIPVRIILFRCSTQLWQDTRRDLGWRRYAASVDVVDVPGDHHTIVDKANAEVVASKFRDTLCWWSLKG